MYKFIVSILFMKVNSILCTKLPAIYIYILLFFRFIIILLFSYVEVHTLIFKPIILFYILCKKQILLLFIFNTLHIIISVTSSIKRTVKPENFKKNEINQFHGQSEKLSVSIV